MICLNKLFSPETSNESTELEREGKGKGERGNYSITRRRSHVIRLSGQVARVAHMDDCGHCTNFIRQCYI